MSKTYDANSVVLKINGIEIKGAKIEDLVIEDLRAKLSEDQGFLASSINLMKVLLVQAGCGCEPISDGGWTCPAHELISNIIRSHSRRLGDAPRRSS